MGNIKKINISIQTKDGKIEKHFFNVIYKSLECLTKNSKPIKAIFITIETSDSKFKNATFDNTNKAISWLNLHDSSNGIHIG